MILLVDAGNSRTKWRVVGAGVVHGQGSLATPELPLHPAAPWHDLPVQAAVIASVAGADTNRSLRAWLDCVGVPLHWVVPAFSAHGIVNRYEAPERLGVDRYAALVAASRMGLGDCVVACAGTALTVDALTASGEFLGGCIVPGPQLMREALAAGTAGVRSAGGTCSALPRNTGNAVETGLSYAMAGVVEAVRAQLRGDGDPPVPVLLSGGARGQLAGRLPAPVVEVDNLVLEGLRWIAEDLGCDV